MLVGGQVRFDPLGIVVIPSFCCTVLIGGAGSELLSQMVVGFRLPS